MRASRFVVNCVLTGAKCADLSKIKSEWLSCDTHRKLIDWAKAQPEGKADVSRMYDAMGYDDKEIQNVLGVNMKFSDANRERDYYNDCLSMLANESLALRLAQLKEKYNDLSDAEQKRATVEEIARLQKIMKSKAIEDKL